MPDPGGTTGGRGATGVGVVAAAILYSLRSLLTPEEDGRAGPSSATVVEVGG